MATKAQCNKALDVYSDQLNSLRNVVGLGSVPTGQEEGSSRDYYIAVYVSKKLPKSVLKKKDLVPSNLKISVNNDLIEVPTCVIEQGKVTLESEEVGLDSL